MLRPNARRATRHAALAAAALLGFAVLHPVSAQQAGKPALALELADALSQAPMAAGSRLSIDLGRGQSAYVRLPEGAGDLVAETRSLMGDADTVMALFDSQGRMLEEDDDGGPENLSSRIEIGARPARAAVPARRPSGRGGGSLRPGA